MFAGTRAIGEIVRKNGVDKTLCFHGDHLGSVDTLSDNTNDTFQQHFDPFRAKPDAANAALTRAGFTGHNSEDDLGLIDMKGRIYDPLAGRFTTPDPITQAPFWSQGLNRYSYVFNNPVNNTDPSGFMANDSEFGTGMTSWGGGVVGMAAAQGGGLSMGFLSGLGAAGLGMGAQVGTSLLNGGYGGGSKGGSYDVPTASAPAGSGCNGGSHCLLSESLPLDSSQRRCRILAK